MAKNQRRAAKKLSRAAELKSLLDKRRRSFDFKPRFEQVGDRNLDRIARPTLTDARRRAGKQKIADVERHEARCELDERRNVENHV